DIFDQEDDIVNFSRIVEPDDNEITFLKRIKSFAKDYRYLNKINKLLGKKDSKDVNMKESDSDLDLEQDKKCKRINKENSNLQDKDDSQDKKREKLDKDNFLARPFYMKGGSENFDPQICIPVIMHIYKEIIQTTDEEL
ncbi:13659_t:CDS:2, partial [Cetraspora pellucida]